MLILPLLTDTTVFCLYRENGQEILFTIKDANIKVKGNYRFTGEEAHFVLKTYTNESKNRMQ